jgi:hypothetical protein
VSVPVPVSTAAGEMTLTLIPSLEVGVGIQEEGPKSTLNTKRCTIAPGAGTDTGLIALHFGLAKTGLCHMVNLRDRKHP